MTPGRVINDNDIIRILNMAFIGYDLLFLFGDEWFPCRCVYARKTRAHFVGTDGGGFDVTGKTLAAGLKNKTIKLVPR